MEGWLKAVHAESGEVLWKFKTPSGIIGNPITYMGPDASSMSPSSRVSGDGQALGLLLELARKIRLRGWEPLVRLQT